jgi:hypothetical protein
MTYATSSTVVVAILVLIAVCVLVVARVLWQRHDNGKINRLQIVREWKQRLGERSSDELYGIAISAREFRWEVREAARQLLEERDA